MQISIFDELSKKKSEAKKYVGPFYLFFDTETTGLPQNYKAPYDDLDNWPRIVQLAWVLTDSQQEIIEQKSLIIKPDGFSIPAASSAVHGITDAKANELGIPLVEALNFLNEPLMSQTPILVAHNIDFDTNVLGAEFLRANLTSNFMDLERICTMKSSVAFCDLNNRKFPKLTELHLRLFGEDFSGAHDALVDVLACSRCFFALKEKGIIS